MDATLADNSSVQQEPEWLLLIHHVPPTPAYFRARVLRQLTQVGAISIKKSIYILPANEETLEDLQWIRQGIMAEGGEAWIFRAQAVAGHTPETLRESFIEARNADYLELLRDAQALAQLPPESTENEVRKLERRAEAIRKIDYFNPPLQQEVIAMINQLRERAQPSDPGHRISALEFHGRRWVTRKGPKIDRIASAWLILRFIDPAPDFVFVEPTVYRHKTGEVRYDMFEGEFTHVGDKCTFEVLVERFAPNDSALAAIGEIVHDIDLKEAKYNRPETPGIAAMIDGIVNSTQHDLARLVAGRGLFDTLYSGLKS